MSIPLKQFSEGHIFLGLLCIVICAGIIAGVMSTQSLSPQVDGTITNFATCASSGRPVMESYPRQCRTDDGRLFVEEVPPVVIPETSTPFEQNTEAVPKGPEVISYPPQHGTINTNGCAIAGCSAQLCVEADTASTIITTCEYRSSYACYRSAVCERQSTDICGWTPSPTLMQCLKETTTTPGAQ